MPRCEAAMGILHSSYSCLLPRGFPTPRFVAGNDVIYFSLFFLTCRLFLFLAVKSGVKNGTTTNFRLT